MRIVPGRVKIRAHRTFVRPFNLRRREREQRELVVKHLRLPIVTRKRGVWAITMVRDEADIVGAAVQHMLDQGIVHVLVVDHLSKDGTLEILRRFDDRVSVIQFDNPAFYQSAVMTLLARHAARCGATWVVPFDADELWWAPGGVALANYLAATRRRVVRGAWWLYLPTPDDDAAVANPCERIVYRTAAADCEYVKVAFKASRRVRIELGNHEVSLRGRRSDGLLIAHYQYRSLNHLQRKVREGVKAISATNFDEEMIYHWRVLAAQDNATLARSWAEMVGTALVRDPMARKLRQ